MAKFGSGKKPANQGSHGSAPTQQPRTSGKPVSKQGGGAPNSSTFRGTHVPGKGGTKAGPKSFKG